MKNASSYSLSISDLIMGFLFIFILILMKFMLEYESQKEDLVLPIEEIRKLIGNIEEEMKEQKIDVEIDKKNSVLKLKSLHYFEKGSYELSSKGKADFKKIEKIFNILICYSDLKKTKEDWMKGTKKNAKQWNDSWGGWVEYCDKKYKLQHGLVDSILVEGHADRTPIGGKLKMKGIETNMELAMKRSQTVFYVLTNYKEVTAPGKSGNYLNSLRNNQGKSLFGVTSYGNLRSEHASLQLSRTLASEDRRIDIRFIMAQPKGLTKELKKELKNIK